MRRRAAIDEIFREDAVCHDPNGGFRGRDEIDRIAGELRATHHDFRYQPIGEPEETGNGGPVRWVEGRRGEAPAHAGTDSSLPAMAGLPPFISFSTSYPELNSAVLRRTEDFRPDEQHGADHESVFEQSGRSLAQVALAWLRHRTVPVIPIRGGRKMSQLQDNLVSLDLELSAEQLKSFDGASRIEAGFPQSGYEKEMVRGVRYGGMWDRVLL